MKELIPDAIADEAERLVFDGKVTAIQYQSEDGRLARIRLEAGVHRPKNIEYREERREGRDGFTILNPGEALVMWETTERRFRGPVTKPIIVENFNGKPISYPYDRQSRERLEIHGIQLKGPLI